MSVDSSDEPQGRGWGFEGFEGDVAPLRGPRYCGVEEIDLGPYL